MAWPDGHARSLLAERLYDNNGLRSLSDLRQFFGSAPVPLNLRWAGMARVAIDAA